MDWFILAALVLPPVIIFAYLHSGRPRRLGYTGNGDIYGPLPNAPARSIEDAHPYYVECVRRQYNRI